MKALIFGGSSLLGRYLTLTKPKWIDLDLTWYSNPIDGYQVDITQKSQVQNVIDRVKPDVIINCSAIGSVDYAEKHYQESFAVNVLGLENIIWAASNSKLVHISSNAVYKGDSPPYNEQSPQFPVNSYGKIKLKAERSLMIHPDRLLIRPFLLYGYPNERGRGNWATIVIEKLSQGKELRLVDDIIWQPTYAYDCAKAIWGLIPDNTKESYNIAAVNKLTLYDLGLEVARVWGLDSNLIKPVRAAMFKGMAPRPVDTSYNLSKVRNTGIKLRSASEGLEAMKGENV